MQINVPCQKLLKQSLFYGCIILPYDILKLLLKYLGIGIWFPKQCIINTTILKIFNISGYLNGIYYRNKNFKSYYLKMYRQSNLHDSSMHILSLNLMNISYSYLRIFNFNFVE